MLYPTPKRPLELLANLGGAMAIGLFFAVVGLNAASGCGETDGQCIGIKDFLGQSSLQIAAR